MELTYTLRDTEAIGAARQPHAEPGNACRVEVSAPADRGDVVVISEREYEHEYQGAEALRCSPRMVCVTLTRSQAAPFADNHMQSVATSASRLQRDKIWLPVARTAVSLFLGSAWKF